MLYHKRMMLLLDATSYHPNRIRFTWSWITAKFALGLRHSWMQGSNVSHLKEH